MAERALLPGGVLAERSQKDDIGGDHAWLIVEPCDDDCHHPIHAFGHDRGIRHLCWYSPNSKLARPVPNPDHQPTTELIMPWDCIHGRCKHDDCTGEDVEVCNTCRGKPFDGDIETVVPWPCKYAPTAEESI